MENLIIRILQDGNLQWAIFTDELEIYHEETITPSALLQVLPPSPSDRNVILLVPGCDVLIKAIKIPAKQRSQLHKILAFLAEEHLAEDIQNLHIIAGNEEEDGLTPVLVVQKSLMSRWLESLKAAGLKPDVLLPETLMLPFDKHCWSILYDEIYTWLRTGPCRATSVESYMFPSLLELYCETHIPSPKALHLMYSDAQNSSHAQSLGKSLSEYYPEMQVYVAPEPTTPFAAFCKGYLQRPSIGSLNLLRGSFARSTAKLKFKSAWQVLAACFAGWFLLQIAIDSGASLYLSNKANAMNEESISLYKQLFPDDKKITNPLKQMKSRLGVHDRTSQNGFLEIMDHMSRDWPALPGNSVLQIQAIDFQDNPPKFDLDVSADTINTVNNLVQMLSTDRMHVTLVSVANESEGTKAKLSLEKADHE